MPNYQKKVLVVEDDQLMRNILKNKLQSEGLAVAIAQDGAEGLRVAIKTKPDLIILDIIMPRLDGISMLRAFWEENPKHKEIPVIFFTNLSDVSIAKEALIDIDVQDYLIKTNWKPQQVIEIVKQRLEE